MDIECLPSLDRDFNVFARCSRISEHLKVANRYILATQTGLAFEKMGWVFAVWVGFAGSFSPKNNGFFGQTDYADEGWQASFFEWHSDCIPKIN